MKKAAQFVRLFSFTDVTIWVSACLLYREFCITKLFKNMKQVIAIFAVVALASISLAQGDAAKSAFSSRSTITSTNPARDFWFAVAQNYDPNDVHGKVFSFYITSAVNTSVNIQIQGQGVVKKLVSANQVLTHTVPRELEINRSSVIETDKAIHIWSDSADLNVYFMSRNDFSSDGTVVLPSYSYGKEYVVAAATALYVSASVDLPSEFIVISTEDNTAVTIIPSQDIRKEGEPATVLHAKGVAFTEFLNKGECIQYQTTQSQDIPWDLSGSVVSSNNPIAVIGASACPFMPADPYCDHVMEMVPSIDRWGTKYFSTQFANRKFGGDSHLIIASRNGQEIYRNDTICATLGKFETYLPDDIKGANVWTSKYPFLIAQYINSSLHAVPSGQSRNSGDPAMMILTPVEQFIDTVIFQTPSITPGSGQSAFTNFANIFVPSASISSTTLDGKLLTSFVGHTQVPIAGTGWEAFTIPNLAIGKHILVSNIGVTANIYGYSTDDSYAWGTTGSGEIVKVHVGGDGLSAEKNAYILSLDPNPTASDAQCTLMITRPMNVSVDLFDMLGKKVQVVKENEFLPSGKSTFRVPLSDLPSGSYILRLNADGIISSKIVKLNK
jgi:hypothetical protein